MAKRRKKTPNFVLRKNEGEIDVHPTRVEKVIESLLRHLSTSNRRGVVYTSDDTPKPISSDFRLHSVRVRAELGGARIDGFELNAYACIKDGQVRAKVCSSAQQRNKFLAKYA